MKTWTRFQYILILLGVLWAGGAVVSAAVPSPGVERFYIGTYTASGSAGIYQASLDLGTGTFGATNLVGATTDPSFIALTSDRRFLYAVNEGPATVSAFAVNSTNGSLTFLNQQPSDGGAPCHVVVDRTDKDVIVANYVGGSVTVFPILTNGRLGAATAHVQHPGIHPHAHYTALDAGDRFALVCDLGLDEVRSYAFDPVAGTLDTNTVTITRFTTGAGPRHIAFDSKFRRAYVLCELNATVVACNYNSANGTLTPFQTNSTLPSNFTAKNNAAEIVVHPSGKFLYASNRGYNSVAVFAINQTDGTLSLVQQQAVGQTPRNFAVDPTGAYCMVANQHSDNIVLYSIDPQTGQLTATGQSLSVSQPVCILPFVLPRP